VLAIHSWRYFVNSSIFFFLLLNFNYWSLSWKGFPSDPVKFVPECAEWNEKELVCIDRGFCCMWLLHLDTSASPIQVFARLSRASGVFRPFPCVLRDPGPRSIMACCVLHYLWKNGLVVFGCAVKHDQPMSWQVTLTTSSLYLQYIIDLITILQHCNW